MAFLDETGLAELWSQVLTMPNRYVWEKTKSEYTKNIGAKETKSAGNTVIVNWYMSDEVEIVDGTVTLVNPVLVSNGANAVGKYVAGWSTGTPIIYYVVSRSYADVANYNYTVQPVTAVLGVTSYGYVNSADPNAYPVNDGYAYTSIGQFGSKVRIATGSYTGTGVSDRSIDVGFKPRFVMILSKTVQNNQDTYYGLLWGGGSMDLSINQYYQSQVSISTARIISTETGFTIKYYGYYNYSGYPSEYIAIG